MTIRITSAEYESAGTIRCAHCWDLRAAYMEVSHTHDHNPDEHLVVCTDCARLAGLLTCSGCAEERLLVRSGATFCEMEPVYAPDALFCGSCVKHAGLLLQPVMT